MIGAVLASLSSWASPCVVLLLALAAMAARRRRLARVALAGFVLLGVPIVASLLLISLPSMMPGMMPGGDASPAAIVVLPGPNPDLVNPGAVEPGGTTLERLRTAAALQRRTHLPILVTSGVLPDGRPPPQAVAMADSLAADFATPVRWTESRSQNLWQSAAASAAMLHASGIDRVYLVADRWEQALASRIFRHAGIAIVLAPVQRPKPRLFALNGILPSAITWLESEWALRQWAGLACDAVRPCRDWMVAGL